MTRLLESSPARIRFRSRPPAWLLSVLWAAFVACLIWLCPALHLEVRRVQPKVADIRVRERLFGLTLSQRTLRGVASASLERPRSGAGRGSESGGGLTLTIDDTARIELDTASGRVPLTRGYTVGSEIQGRVVEQINGFLGAVGPERIELPIRNSLWIWGVGLFLGFAALGATVGSWCECTVDREEDVVRLRWAGVPRARVAEYRLSEVERFLVFETGMGFGRYERGRKEFRTLGMRLRDGSEVSLTRQLTSGTSAAMAELAVRLERFRGGRGRVE